MIVPNRRRVHQFQATAATLLRVMRRREAGLLVIVQRVHLCYAGPFASSITPSLPTHHVVQPTLSRPFRMI